MVAVYCTPEDVARAGLLTNTSGDLLQFGETIKTPDEATIVEFIEIAEEYLEDECQSAWGTKERVVTDELHDFYADLQEASFHLNHANVLTLSTGDGDKLECWTGEAWTDYIITYTEGRGDSFFVDYSLGKVYFYSDLPNRGKSVIKVTYRYNANDTVPKAIKMATALYVCKLLALSEHMNVLFPEGEGGGLSVGERISKWEKLITKLIGPHVVSLTADMPFEPVRI